MAKNPRGSNNVETVDAATRRRGLRFALVTAVALLVTHAIVYFQHEYSHSGTAWLLSFKAEPLAITYGNLDLSNILLQQQVDENVDYTSIINGGHGFDVAVIALAGWISNLVFYLVFASVLKKYLLQMRPPDALFVFWLALMESANLWSYSPVRVIATHADMANAARGLGISTWTLFPFVVLPTLWVAWNFFSVLMPRVLARTCGDDVLRRVFATAIACFIFFGFFGGISIVADYGNVSAVISILSVFVFLPITLTMTLAPIPFERSVPSSRGARPD